jgi:hypothetical protein
MILFSIGDSWLKKLLVHIESTVVGQEIEGREERQK